MIALSRYEKPWAALISNPPVRIEEMRHHSSAALVYVVGCQPVRRVEVGNPLAKRPLLPLQPLGFAFPESQLDKKGLQQRRHRRIALSRDHTSPSIGLVIECDTL